MVCFCVRNGKEGLGVGVGVDGCVREGGLVKSMWILMRAVGVQ